MNEVKDPADMSPADVFRELPKARQEAFMGGLKKSDKAVLWFNWTGWWARPKQHVPAWNWLVWEILAGRGFGKTRVGCEWVNSQAKILGAGGRIALVARTPADVRDVIIEGESGLLNISPPWFKPKWEPSKRRLSWPNGCIATTYSSHKPDELRGPQHHRAYCDELAAWQYQNETWDNLQMGLRLKDKGATQCVVTTTPKPQKLLRDLRDDEDNAYTTGSTYENLHNVSENFRKTILSRYEGTRTGRQELHAELMTEAEGALWKQDHIERRRLPELPTAERDLRQWLEQMQRIVVAIDPQVSNDAEEADEAGVVVAGLGYDGQGYVLKDASGRLSPNEWAAEGVHHYHFFRADRLLGEQNNGGDLVENTVRTIDGRVSYKKLWASRGKAARAEPISALYEQGKVHHCGAFNALEDEMCNWEPNTGQPSPNRLDALVWALTELMLETGDIEEQKIVGV